MDVVEDATANLKGDFKFMDTAGRCTTYCAIDLENRKLYFKYSEGLTLEDFIRKYNGQYNLFTYCCDGKSNSDRMTVTNDLGEFSMNVSYFDVDQDSVSTIENDIKNKLAETNCDYYCNIKNNEILSIRKSGGKNLREYAAAINKLTNNAFDAFTPCCDGKIKNRSNVALYHPNDSVSLYKDLTAPYFFNYFNFNKKCKYYCAFNEQNKTVSLVETNETIVDASKSFKNYDFFTYCCKGKDDIKGNLVSINADGIESAVDTKLYSYVDFVPETNPETEIKTETKPKTNQGNLFKVRIKSKVDSQETKFNTPPIPNFENQFGFNGENNNPIHEETTSIIFEDEESTSSTDNENDVFEDKSPYAAIEKENDYYEEESATVAIEDNSASNQNDPFSVVKFSSSTDFPFEGDPQKYLDNNVDDSNFEPPFAIPGGFEDIPLPPVAEENNPSSNGSKSNPGNMPPVPGQSYMPTPQTNMPISLGNIPLPAPGQPGPQGIQFGMPGASNVEIPEIPASTQINMPGPQSGMPAPQSNTPAPQGNMPPVPGQSFVSVNALDMPVSTNWRCGNEYGRCPDGYCCSRYGYCGQSSDHCIDRCQKAFGVCYY